MIMTLFPVWIPIIYKNTTNSARQIPSPERVSGVAFGMSPQLREGWCALDSSMWNHFSPGLLREKLPTNGLEHLGKVSYHVFFGPNIHIVYIKNNRFSFCNDQVLERGQRDSMSFWHLGNLNLHRSPDTSGQREREGRVSGARTWILKTNSWPLNNGVVLRIYVAFFGVLQKKTKCSPG